MDNVFHYMLNGWAELQNYPMDGNYAIDNMIAERVQTFYCKQKNFVLQRDAGVDVVATYLTIMKTAKMYGLEVRDYLVYIFREIMNGNKDYRE